VRIPSERLRLDLLHHKLLEVVDVRQMKGELLEVAVQEVLSELDLLHHLTRSLVSVVVIEGTLLVTEALSAFLVYVGA
jgi:hypothetical protein